MATFVAASATTTLPTGTTTGDWVVLFAYSSTATTPVLPTGWTTIVSNAATPALHVMYRAKDASWTAIPTVTSSTRTEAVTVRPAAGKVLALGTTPAIEAGNATQAVWATFTLTDATGTSVILRGAVSARRDAIFGAPTGHTAVITPTGTQPAFGTFIKTTTTDAATATSTGTNARNAANTRGQVELRDVNPPAQFQGLGGATASATADAAGIPVRAGTGAATSVVVADATGLVVATGAADGTASVAGEGAGEAVVLTGTVEVAWAEFAIPAAADTVLTGTGAATVDTVGAASGAPILLGAGDATATVTGAAAGVRLASGAGTATATSSGTAAGLLVAAGAATATAAVAATGTGAPVTTIPSGTGNATAATSATATGASVLVGAGAATSSSGATGAGTPLPVGTGTATVTTSAAGAGGSVSSHTAAAALAVSAQAQGIAVLAGLGAASVVVTSSGAGGEPTAFQPWMRYPTSLALVAAPGGGLALIDVAAAAISAYDLADAGLATT